MNEADKEELRAALLGLCREGLLTCTKGEPGQPGASYALAWFPLDNSEEYSDEVRELHEKNMRRFARD